MTKVDVEGTARVETDAGSGSGVRTPSRKRWLRRFHRRGPAELRLICFPHAGGTASSFYGLSAALPAHVELLAVQYPGRHDRTADPLVPDIEALAAGTTAELRETVVDGLPTFLLGHSMGSLAAYQTAHYLTASGVPPRGLIPSAAVAPHNRFRDTHRLPDADLLADLSRLGGLDEELLGDPDFVATVLPVIRNDLRASETFRVAPTPTPLPCPILALFGAQDSFVEAELVDGWRRYTSAGFRMRAFDGGHFYLDQRRDEVLGELVGFLEPGATGG